MKVTLVSDKLSKKWCVILMWMKTLGPASIFSFMSPKVNAFQDCFFPGGVQARLDGALGSQIKWVANLPTTGGMKLDDLYGPFQARPF